MSNENATPQLTIDHLPQIGFATQRSICTSNLQKAVLVDCGRALQNACHALAEEAGWWMDTENGDDVRSWPPKFFKLWVGTKLALVHSEISESLEGHRKDRMDDHLPNRKQIEVELADAIIRALDLAGGLRLDVGAAIVEKLAYNARRADHKVESRVADGGKSY